MCTISNYFSLIKSNLYYHCFSNFAVLWSDFIFLETGSSVHPRQDLKSSLSCHSLLSASTTGMLHYVEIWLVFKNNYTFLKKKTKNQLCLWLVYLLQQLKWLCLWLVYLLQQWHCLNVSKIEGGFGVYFWKLLADVVKQVMKESLKIVLCYL